MDQFSSTNLDGAGYFGPFHGSNRRRSGKQMISLSHNFECLRAGRPEGKEEEEKKEKSVKRGYS